MRQPDIKPPAAAATRSHGWRDRLPPAFRYPAYRIYWGGMLASVIGFQVFQFTQFLLIHHLTGSAIYLGFVGLATAVPSLFLTLFGGVVADKIDKRRLLLLTQVTSAALMALLASLTFTGLVAPWHVIAVAFMAGAVFAFDNPARQSLYPRLVDRAALTSAVAFQSVIWQSTRIAGPAVAGLIVANLGGTEERGMAIAFMFATIGFLVMGIVMARLVVPAPAETRARSSGIEDLKEGLRFIRGNTVVMFLILMSFVNGLFGGAYITLMPAIARDVLGVNADLQGWLLSCSGIGALSVTLVLGTGGSLRWRAPTLIGGASAYGLLVAAFAITAERIGSYPLALGLLVAMGVAQAAYMIIIQTTLVTMVPDRLRGRVMGFFGITYAMLPLSGLQAALIAEFVGVPTAVAIGGFVVTAFALGPALLNSRIRELSLHVRQADAASAASAAG
jgi:MFS family permease